LSSSFLPRGQDKAQKTMEWGQVALDYG